MNVEYSDGLVSAGTDDVLVAWHEADRGDGVFVAWKCLCVFVFGLRVPYLDEQVRGARDYGRAGERKRGRGGEMPTEEMAFVVEIEIVDGLCVALEGALEVACLPVPDLDGGVLAGGGDYGVEGVESELGDGCAVAGEGVGWRVAGEPVCVGCTLCGCGREVVLEGGVAGLEVEDLGADSGGNIRGEKRMPFSGDG